MMKKLAFTLLCIGLLVIVGCKDRQQQRYITQLDQLSSSLDSMNTIASRVKISQYDSITQIIQQTLSSIKQHYKEDTVSLAVAQNIEAYKEILNAFSTNSGNLAKVKTNIPIVQQKLKDLKHDIKNGVNNRNKYDDFLNHEKENVAKIKKILSYYLSISTSYTQRFDTLQPKMEAFANRLIQQP